MITSSLCLNAWQLTSTTTTTMTKTSGTFWSASISVSLRCRRSDSATTCPVQAWTRGRRRRNWSSARCTCSSDWRCWRCASSSSRRKSAASCAQSAFASVCWTPTKLGGTWRSVVFDGGGFGSYRDAHDVADQWSHSSWTYSGCRYVFNTVCVFLWFVYFMCVAALVLN